MSAYQFPQAEWQVVPGHLVSNYQSPNVRTMVLHTLVGKAPKEILQTDYKRLTSLSQHVGVTHRGQTHYYKFYELLWFNRSGVLGRQQKGLWVTSTTVVWGNKQHQLHSLLNGLTLFLSNLCTTLDSKLVVCLWNLCAGMVHSFLVVQLQLQLSTAVTLGRSLFYF